MTLLAVKSLSISFTQGDTVTHAVRHASLEINKGETLALVGESGSGKSVTALSALKLLPQSASYPSGHIMLGDQDILPLSDRTMRSIRGNRISMIFQEPMTSLNPLHTIEKQISEVLFIHRKMKADVAKARCIELLELVGLPHFKERLNAYPHELSGGQRQRVMIAMALANEPELLIADEPTTALDVTVQKQILTLLKDIQKRTGMAVWLITHDLTIVRRVADRVAVMKDGEIVETKPTKALFASPEHSYTKMLLSSEPKGGPEPLPAKAKEILDVKRLNVAFALKKNFFGKPIKWLRAVKDASITVKEGETLGIVGESGSGKTTLAMAALRLIRSSGSILFNDVDISRFDSNAMRPLRAQMQVVFQDPFASLNPRMTVGQIIEEGLVAHAIGADKAEREQKVIKALKEVELDPAMRHRYPHEFSGGQRQRIAIARAIVLEPKLLVLDEPTSALDLTVQSQIIALLKRLQKEYKMAYLFISHDLRAVKAISHRLIVMKAGEVVETGTNKHIFSNPKQDYTQKLIEAAFPK